MGTKTSTTRSNKLQLKAFLRKFNYCYATKYLWNKCIEQSAQNIYRTKTNRRQQTKNNPSSLINSCSLIIPPHSFISPQQHNHLSWLLNILPASWSENLPSQVWLVWGPVHLVCLGRNISGSFLFPSSMNVPPWTIFLTATSSSRSDDVTLRVC